MAAAKVAQLRPRVTKNKKIKINVRMVNHPMLKQKKNKKEIRTIG